MRHEKPRPTSPGALMTVAAVGVALLYAGYSGDLLRPLMTDPIFKTPYLASTLVNLSDLLVMAVLLCLAGRMPPWRLIDLTGLKAPALKPLLWAAILFVPSLAIASLATSPASTFTGHDLFWQGVGFPVIEEVLYRGLAVAALIRCARWPWPVACLLPAVFFGLVHMSQGSGAMETVGIVAITGLGGLLFGWLFVRWGFNLWPPILLHVGLNSQWILFDLGEDAMGGWLGNGLRLAVVIAAIGLTFVLAPRRSA